MISRAGSCMSCFVLLLCSSAAAPPATHDASVSGDAPTTSVVISSIVSVTAEFRAPLIDGTSNEILLATGSGFVVDSAGYIVTANHVIERLLPNNPARRADKITVTFHDGSKAEAKVAAADASDDLAVLRVDRGGLRPLVFGDSSTLKPGMPLSWICFAAGAKAPTMLQGTLSSVSPTGKVLELAGKFSVGCAGGPVLDSSGKAVGMITQFLSPARDHGSSLPPRSTTGPPAVLETAGYAISANRVKSPLASLGLELSR